ncbi:helix-turn-helix domain-containing protein [Rhodovulum sp. DZ06]|uniref:helix-turn-helix domain-containing protein n=1 Tax=Rhodovulum sp. DZ06 TaxID=3425126 RepID=UPI003D334126
MTSTTAHATLERVPSDIDRSTANSLRQVIAACQGVDGSSRLDIVDADRGTQTVALSPALSEALLSLLRIVGSGHGCRLVPMETMLTTQQAADILNVSRPHFVKLLEDGELPHTKAGRHRRVKAEDVFAFKERRDRETEQALYDLVEYDVEKGYY